MKRRELVFTAPSQVSICESDLPDLQDDQVMVQAIISAVSPGTEMLFYHGQFPRDLAVDENIPALKQETVAYPLKYGYSLVGRVVALGAQAEPSWYHRLVFAFNPHESHFAARTEQLIPIPHGISLEDAVFLPNMETAVNLVMDGSPLIGERVAVFGQGVVGLLTTALLAQFPLGRLVTFDRYPNRRQRSLELGAHGSFDPSEAGQAKALLPEDADLTYELSGSLAGLDQAVAITGYAGRIIIGSWYGQKPGSLDLGGSFHRSRIRMVSSQVSTIAPQLSGRWTKGRRFGVSWDMIRKIGPSQLITQRIPIEQAASAYQTLDREPNNAVQILFTYEQE